MLPDAYDAVRGVSARERDPDLGPSMAPGDGCAGSQLRGLTTSRWPTVQRRKISHQPLREREQNQPSHETRPFFCPARVPYTARDRMMGMKIGYARVSTVGQDLTAQPDGLAALGVDAERIYVDHGLTGTSWAAPCTSRPIRSVACCTTSSRWSRSSRPT